MNSESAILDVLIVGGGPAGLSAATWLGRARRKTLLVDSGRPRNAAALRIHGFLTRDGCHPQTIRRLALKQLAKYEIETLDDEVVSVVRTAPTDRRLTEFTATLRSGRTIVCRKVLFATGTCDELPALDGFDECYGVSIHHCPYCDGWEHRDKPLVAYSDDSTKAAGLGLLLRGWSAQVTVVTNGRPLEAGDRHRLALGKVAFAEERIVRLHHRGRRLYRIEFERGEPVAAAAMFFAAPQRQQCDLPEDLGCVREERTFLKASDRQCSTVPGVFLAGDAEGDVQFAIVAAAEGAKAAVAINKELQEEDRIFAGIA